MMKTTLYDNYPQLKADLIQVQQIIQQELNNSEHQFSQLIKSIFNDNSKLIRPALCLISSQSNPKVKQQALTLAAAIEMLHVASLIHDDIIDQAKTRRNQPTINYQYDDGYAVICGDYLFAKSFQLLIKDKKLLNIAQMTDNLATMVFGEVEQYLDKYDETITIERYLDIIEKKTASFFTTALVLGANLAKLKASEITTLQYIGHNAGLLFQIQDDLLDFKTSEEIGKSAKSDILRGTYSLPIIIALEESISFKEYLTTHKDNLDFDIVINMLQQTNALSRTQTYIDNYYNKVIMYLEQLSDPLLKEQLSFIIGQLIKREK